MTTIINSIGTRIAETNVIDSVTGTGPWIVGVPAGISAGTKVGDAFFDEHATPRAFRISNVNRDDDELTVVDSYGVGGAPDNSGTSTAETRRSNADVGDWNTQNDSTDMYTSGDISFGKLANDGGHIACNSETLNAGDTSGITGIILGVYEEDKSTGVMNTGAGLEATVAVTHMLQYGRDYTDKAFFQDAEMDAAGNLAQSGRCFGQLTTVNTSDRTNQVVRRVLFGNAYGNRFNKCIDAGNRPLTSISCMGFRVNDGLSTAGSGTCCFVCGDDKLDVLHFTGLNIDMGTGVVNIPARGIVRTGTTMNVRGNVILEVSNPGNTEECIGPAGTFANKDGNITTDGTGDVGGTNVTASEQIISAVTGSEDLRPIPTATGRKFATPLSSSLEGNIDFLLFDRDSVSGNWDSGAITQIFGGALANRKSRLTALVGGALV